MSGVKLGGKITASHGSTTETAAIIVSAATKFEEVTKVSLGIIKHIGGGGKRRIKITSVPAGLKVVVRGSGSVQDLFIFTGKPEVTQKKLLKITKDW